MFKCCECGAEFDIKPDYCDCGNDTFEEVIVQHTATITEEQKNNIPSENIQVDTIQKIETDTNNFEVKTVKNKPVFWEPVSTIIFLGCIIMSFLIIFFAWNPKEETDKITDKTNEENININIPKLDSFWDNTAPKPEKKDVSTIVINPEPKQEEIIINPSVQTRQVAPTTITTTAQPKQIKQTQQIPPLTNTTKPTQITNTASQNTQTSKQVATTSQQSQPAKTQVQQQVQTQVPQKQPQTITTNTQNIQTAPKQPVLNQQEYSQYKKELRNRIAAKINFLGIIGDGTCSVGFTISPSGNLINRKFIKQSENFSLNDTVYNAVMNTPSFNPPPTGYKNQQLKLTVTIYNGNFEVSLN